MNKKILLGILLITTIVPTFSFAGSLLFVGKNIIPVGNTQRITLVIDTINEPINAINIVIHVPNGVNVSDIYTYSSIIKFFTERPVFNENTRTIHISGIIPGGYAGTRGTILEYNITPYFVGPFAFSTTNTLFLKNDGNATEVNIQSIPFDFSASNAVENNKTDRNIDTNPPEHFIPTLVKSPFSFEGKWVLVFYAEDRESSIEKYLVSENGNIYEATSPYVLRDQSIKGPITVTAVDIYSNKQTEPVTKPVLNSSPLLLFFAIFAIIGLIFYGLYKKK